MWNALKLLKMWEANLSADANNTSAQFAMVWFAARLTKAQMDVHTLLKQFKLSEALKVMYSLIWDDFCSWYLEWIKPEYGTALHTDVYRKTVTFFTQLLEMLHPFMPFITEELNELLGNEELLCTKQVQVPSISATEVIATGDMLKNIITSIRDVRNKQQLKPKESIQVHIDNVAKETYRQFEAILQKQVNADAIVYTDAEVANSISIVHDKYKIYLTSNYFKSGGAAQKDDLEKDLAYLKSFLASVEKKLGNEKFVANAKPEILAIEQKKKADALEKISLIQAALAGM
jgi:valyl-tRNA synthetase